MSSLPVFAAGVLGGSVTLASYADTLWNQPRDDTRQLWGKSMAAGSVGRRAWALSTMLAVVGFLYLLAWVLFVLPGDEATVFGLRYRREGQWLFAAGFATLTLAAAWWPRAALRDVRRGRKSVATFAALCGATAGSALLLAAAVGTDFEGRDVRWALAVGAAGWLSAHHLLLDNLLWWNGFL